MLHDDVLLMSELEIEQAIRAETLDVDDLPRLLNHPEWKSFSPEFRGWVWDALNDRITVDELERAYMGR